LLTKLGAQITLTQGGPTSFTVRGPNALIMAVTIPTEDEWQLYCQKNGDLVKPICLLEEFPSVWAKRDPPSLAYNHVPIMVDLKLGAVPIRQMQYSVPWEAHLRIQTHLQQLKDAGILIECQLPRNIPLLLTKKARGDNHWPVQDLQVVKNPVITLHPVVPKSLYSPDLPMQASFFICLDLNNTFFCLLCLPLNEKAPILEEKHK
jgi:hypothetical protein